MNWIKVAQLSVTVINEVIEIMKENKMEGIVCKSIDTLHEALVNTYL